MYMKGINEKKYAICVIMSKESTLQNCRTALFSRSPTSLLYPSFQTLLIDYQLSSF